MSKQTREHFFYSVDGYNFKCNHTHGFEIKLIAAYLVIFTEFLRETHFILLQLKGILILTYLCQELAQKLTVKPCQSTMK